MFGGLRRVAALVLFALVMLAPLPSHAFCGFYVNTGDQPLYNEATHVALMRSGMRTVISIQNDYSGPIDDFALVIPVPIVLERENVRTLPHTLFDRVDRLSSPRLVEYWEQNPCAYTRYDSSDNKEGGTGTRAKGEEGSMGNPNKKLVIVEREFKVDEYDVVILSAKDSGALEIWLHENNYKIPNGAEPYFRPYVQDGSKFFVARVDINRVKMRWNRAKLSPLRFHYDTPEFKLPIRLGLINSNGVQDLLVYILGEQRYETANYENLFIPTNLELTEEARSKFNTFYAALFDKTLVGHEPSVVTEYSWSPESCDPCPDGAGPLAPEDAQLLGLDVIKPAPSQLVLTRLHARYGKKSVGDDLVFRTASPVTGGRQGSSHGADASSQNFFQARYIIRHYWTASVDCPDPRWGTWGGPDGDYPPSPKSNPLASRDLKVDDYIVDEKSVARGAGEGPTVHGIQIGNTTYDWHPFVGLRHILDPSSWDSNTGEKGLLISWGVALAGALIWTRRRRTGVLTTLGLFVAFSVLAIFIASGPMTVRNHVVHDWSPRYFVREGLVFLGTVVMVAGIAAGRTSTRALWAFVPVVAGLVRALQEKASIERILKTDATTIDLEQLSRIRAESTAEAFQPILIGATISGFFVVLSLVLNHEKREGAKWHYAAGAFVLAAVARNFLAERNGVDLIALAVFGGAAFVIARAKGFNALLGAVSGVLLLDIASRLFVTSEGLDAISGESVDTGQIARILQETVQFEGRHVLVSAIDLGLLVGLFAILKPPVGFIDWRTAMAAAALLLVAATPFEWYGSRNAIGALDPVHGHNATLTGPTLYVRGTQLLATPSAEVEPVPYAPGVAEKMARAESGASPLLVAEAEHPFASLLDALAPLLRLRQYDYRLLETVDPPPELGIYGSLVSARNARPVLVDIVPKLDGPTLRASNATVLTVRWNGERASIRVRNGSSAAMMVPLRTKTSDDSEGWGKVEDDIQRYRVQEGTLAAPSDTPISTIGELLAKLGRLKITRVTLSPDVAVLDSL